MTRSVLARVREIHGAAAACRAQQHPMAVRRGRGKLGMMRTRLNSLPLFWRVFGTNGAVLVLAFVALVVAPVTVSVPPTAAEVVVLAVGLVSLLALNLTLLRPAFRPLDELV